MAKKETGEEKIKKSKEVPKQKPQKQKKEKVEKSTKKKDKVKPTSDAKKSSEKAKPIYVICPRCELNYIDKKDIMCTVCKAETGLVDKSILMPDEEEAGIEKFCPNCHINYIGEDEEICFLCQKEKQERLSAATELDGDWESEELEEDPLPPVDMDISLSELEEEEKFDDERDETIKSPVDDFEYVSPDEYDEYLDDDDEDFE